MSQPLLPVSAALEKEKKAGLSLHPAFYIASWIFFSNVIILFNKWLIDDAGFRYPVTLTFWHMAFASLATQILARTTSWLDGRHKVQMTKRFYVRAVLPIGFLYSGSMVCSNLVYLHLSVAFIQMLKAAAPFSTLIVSWLWGQENPSRQKIVKILIVVFGVLLASAGEIHFSIVGFTFQLGGLIFESLRVVMVKDLMSDDGASMDPMVSLYYYAPICALLNLFVAFGAEWQTFQWSAVSHVGVWILVLNAFVAFLLNVSSVMLIGKTSALILHLCGVLKNILLVMISIVIWGTTIAPLQALGYGIALIGMVLYRATWEEIKDGLTALLVSYEGTRKIRSYSNQQSSVLFRRGALAVAVLLMTLVLFLSCIHGERVRLPSWASSSQSTAVDSDRLALKWPSRLGYGR
ncbi:putative DUF250 domain membrane protein [Seiridium cardinale]|uniref:DUF250 domain membrane protein n=1 Tax=Seiridium cardinale TaxID=138064 RepID=A0ABR2XJ54_9PEZI